MKLPSLKAPLNESSANEIRRRLKEAEDDLPRLESEYADGALAVIDGDRGAEQDLAPLRQKVLRARERVETLRAAVTAAERRDAERLAAQRAALRKTQITALKRHLSARDTAAQKLTAALADAVREYHLMLEHSEQALAIPLGGDVSVLEGSLAAPGEIRRSVAAEIFRISGVAETLGHNQIRKFPGAQCPSTDFADRPDAWPMLTDRFRRDTATIAERLAKVEA